MPVSDSAYWKKEDENILCISSAFRSITTEPVAMTAVRVKQGAKGLADACVSIENESGIHKDRIGDVSRSSPI